MTDETQNELKVTPGTLGVNEAHPAAYGALEWIRGLDPADLAMHQEAFASCALSGNRMAQICSETMDRLIKGKPVSDRYLLGLAWSMKYSSEGEECVNPQTDDS